MLFPKDDEFSTGVRTLGYMLKTMYVMALFLIGMWLLITFVVVPEEQILLRAFPYPFKAALAFSNDVEGIETPEEFIAIQRYLCTRKTTPWGKGLGMEIGASVNCFDVSGVSEFTIFKSELRTDTLISFYDDKGDSLIPPDTTIDYSLNFNGIPPGRQVIADFIKAGYLDAINGYGFFGEAGFKREYAELTAEFFNNTGLTVPVWMNLPAESSYQCLGRKPKQQGDNPGSECYHADILPAFGVRYLNFADHTAMIGLEAEEGIDRWLKKQAEFVKSAWTSTRDMKIDLNWNNRLLNEYTLDDGRKFFRFRSFINPEGIIPEGGFDVNYLAKQLSDEILDRLIEVEGYMILHTRLGDNESYAEWIPSEARAALANLARRFENGEIMVTTSSRLLDYYIVSEILDWTWTKKGDAYIIEINKQPLETSVNFEITREVLQGLTFYTPAPEKTRIIFEGAVITPMDINIEEESGRSSVSIPWKWLTFPPGY